MSVELAINLNRIANALRRKPNKKASLMLKAMLKRAMTADDFGISAYIYVPQYIIANVRANQVDAGPEPSRMDASSAARLLSAQLGTDLTETTQAIMRLSDEVSQRMTRIGQSILKKFSNKRAEDALESIYELFTLENRGSQLGAAGEPIQSLKDLTKMKAPLGITIEREVLKYLRSKEVSQMIDMADEDMPEGKTQMEQALEDSGILPDSQTINKELIESVIEDIAADPSAARAAVSFFKTNSFREAQALSSVITACSGFTQRGLKIGTLNAISVILMASHTPAAVFKSDEREMADEFLLKFKPSDVPDNRQRAAVYIQEMFRDLIALDDGNFRYLAQFLSSMKVPMLDIEALVKAVMSSQFVPNLTTVMNKILLNGVVEVMRFESGLPPKSQKITPTCLKVLKKLSDATEMKKMRRRLDIKSPRI